MSGTSLAVIGWSYFSAAALYGAYAFAFGRVWHSEPRRPLAAYCMLLAMVATAMWGISGVGFALTDSETFVSLGFIADGLRYAAWQAFALALMRESADKQTTPRTVGALPAFFAAIVLIPQIGYWLHIPVALTRVAATTNLLSVVATLVLLEQLLRNASTDSQWSVKPLCVGVGGAALFDLFLFSDTMLFRQLDADAYAVRGFAHAIVIPLIALSATRSRGWVERMRLSRTVVFHSATVTMVGGYLLFMAGVGYYIRSFGGDWGRALQISLTFAALLGLMVIVFSGTVRSRLRVLIGKHFFNYRYDYRDEWLRFTQALSAQETPAVMVDQVIRGLANLVESPSGGLWVKGPGNAEYLQFSRWNIPSSTEAEPADSSLCRFMLQSGWVVNLEEYRSYPSRYVGLELPGWLVRTPNAWLIVPLMSGADMIGFVILGSSRTVIDVNWEINDLLRTAGRQAASYLAQMQATEALLEARKFDAFNRMSAFVVHDLKNIVTQLSLMLRNAERHKSNPEFQEDMLMTVQHSVERMRQLMLQLREGATPPGTPVGVNLADMIEKVAQGKRALGRNIEIDVVDSPMTRGQSERLERVIGHLVQNALEATSDSGRVWIKLDRSGGSARVEVGDTGTGMSPEFVRERLFKPFQTTKQSGMGIGAYESFQYVRELGGTVSVDSEIGTGTRITLLLPLFDAAVESDLRHREAA